MTELTSDKLSSQVCYSNSEKLVDNGSFTKFKTAEEKVNNITSSGMKRLEHKHIKIKDETVSYFKKIDPQKQQNCCNKLSCYKHSKMQHLSKITEQVPAYWSSEASKGTLVLPKKRSPYSTVNPIHCKPSQEYISLLNSEPVNIVNFKNGKRKKHSKRYEPNCKGDILPIKVNSQIRQEKIIHYHRENNAGILDDEMLKNYKQTIKYIRDKRITEESNISKKFHFEEKIYEGQGEKDSNVEDIREMNVSISRTSVVPSTHNITVTLTARNETSLNLNNFTNLPLHAEETIFESQGLNENAAFTSHCPNQYFQHREYSFDNSINSICNGNICTNLNHVKEVCRQYIFNQNGLSKKNSILLLNEDFEKKLEIPDKIKALQIHYDTISNSISIFSRSTTMSDQDVRTLQTNSEEGNVIYEHMKFKSLSDSCVSNKNNINEIKKGWDVSILDKQQKNENTKKNSKFLYTCLETASRFNTSEESNQTEEKNCRTYMETNSKPNVQLVNSAYTQILYPSENRFLLDSCKFFNEWKNETQGKVTNGKKKNDKKTSGLSVNVVTQNSSGILSTSDSRTKKKFSTPPVREKRKSFKNIEQYCFPVTSPSLYYCESRLSIENTLNPKELKLLRSEKRREKYMRKSKYDKNEEKNIRNGTKNKKDENYRVKPVKEQVIVNDVNYIGSDSSQNEKAYCEKKANKTSSSGLGIKDANLAKTKIPNELPIRNISEHRKENDCVKIPLLFSNKENNVKSIQGIPVFPMRKDFLAYAQFNPKFKLQEDIFESRVFEDESEDGVHYHLHNYDRSFHSEVSKCRSVGNLSQCVFSNIGKDKMKSGLTISRSESWDSVIVKQKGCYRYSNRGFKRNFGERIGNLTLSTSCAQELPNFQSYMIDEMGKLIFSKPKRIMKLKGSSQKIIVKPSDVKDVAVSAYPSYELIDYKKKTSDKCVMCDDNAFSKRGDYLKSSGLFKVIESDETYSNLGRSFLSRPLSGPIITDINKEKNLLKKKRDHSLNRNLNEDLRNVTIRYQKKFYVVYDKSSRSTPQKTLWNCLKTGGHKMFTMFIPNGSLKLVNRSKQNS